jgi:hypothetical protein
MSVDYTPIMGCLTNEPNPTSLKKTDQIVVMGGRGLQFSAWSKTQVRSRPKLKPMG